MSNFIKDFIKLAQVMTGARYLHRLTLVEGQYTYFFSWR